jgi:hypothetical protein
MFVRDVTIKFSDRTVGVQGGDEPNRLTWSASAANHDMMTKEMTTALFRLMLWGLGVGSNATGSHWCCQDV